MIIAYRGVAHPWLCDAMGHLNVRHYVAMFDDANTHFLASIGWDPEDMRISGRGWADVRAEIDYVAEVAAGALVEVVCGVARVGNKSLTVVAEMRARQGGEVHARMNTTLVRFDLDGRRAIPLEDSLRQRAEAELVADD